MSVNVEVGGPNTSSSHESKENSISYVEYNAIATLQMRMYNTVDTSVAVEAVEESAVLGLLCYRKDKRKSPTCIQRAFTPQRHECYLKSGCRVFWGEDRASRKQLRRTIVWLTGRRRIFVPYGLPIPT